MDNENQNTPSTSAARVLPVTPPFPKINFWKVFIASLVFGLFGIDRFITGKTKTGLVKLLTFGGFGLWYIVDLVQLLRGKFRDAFGTEIVNPSPKATWRIAVVVILIELACLGSFGGGEVYYEGGAGGGASRHVVMLDGEAIVVVLIQDDSPDGKRAVVQGGTRKIKLDEKDRTLYSCTVDAGKPSEWDFELLYYKPNSFRGEGCDLLGYNYGVRLDKMSADEIAKFKAEKFGSGNTDTPQNEPTDSNTSQYKSDKQVVLDYANDKFGSPGPGREWRVEECPPTPYAGHDFIVQHDGVQYRATVINGKVALFQ